LEPNFKQRINKGLWLKDIWFSHFDKTFSG
jgi:hypothetical protein